LFKTCELSWKASTTEGLSFAFCRQLPTGCGLSVLQDLGTGVQDFFADVVKVSMRAKFIFAEGFSDFTVRDRLVFDCRVANDQSP